MWVEDGCTASEVDENFWDGESREIGWLFGQLWHCSDIMPSTLCYDLDMERGSTAVNALAPKRLRLPRAERPPAVETTEEPVPGLVPRLVSASRTTTTPRSLPRL